MFRYWKLAVIVSVAALVMGLGRPALAGTVDCGEGILEDCVLTDDNSTASFDLDSQAGNYSWITDDTENMNQQWFWYRIGDTAEKSIDTLFLDTALLSDTNGSGDDNFLFVKYCSVSGCGSGFMIEINFSLDGGADGSGTADLSEDITITLISGGSLEFHFYEYADFDLNGDADFDVVKLVSPTLVQQKDAGSVLSETSAISAAQHTELDFFSTTLIRLNDAVATTLNDSTGPVGPGDVTWALQWDFTLSSSFQISKDKKLSVIPEPGTLTLFGFGLIGLAILGRRYRYRVKTA